MPAPGTRPAVAILVICVLLLIALGLIGHERVAAYHYDVTRDEQYDFSRAQPQAVAVRLQGGVLQVPAVRAGDTVLLAARVRHTLLGRWFEPRVRVDGAGGSITQAFARGVSALNYINLSSLNLTAGGQLHLSGRYLRLDDQPVTLYMFHSDLDLDHQTILLISPHPDDAEIAAYGLYDGHHAYVVTVTAGEGGYAGIFSMFGGSQAFLEKGRARAWDSLAVPLLAGLPPDHVANLGYFDSTLRTMQASPAQAVSSPTSGANSLSAFGGTLGSDLIPPRAGRAVTLNDLVADLQYVVNKVNPDIIVTPYPLLDAHPDHEMSTIALIQALQQMHWTHGSLLLYSNHLPWNLLFPDGLPGDDISLPPGNANPVFDSIVSYPLTPAEQARKYMALDAMIDIRPEIHYTVPGMAHAFLHTLRQKVLATDDSYYRRAVRSNELFFELHASSLSEPDLVRRLESTPEAARGLF